MGQAVCCRC
jgi:hypothetical protein